MESASFLVTGGCGLQGTYIVIKLREKYPSAAVAVMSRNPTENIQQDVAYHAGDITNPDHIARVFVAVKPTVVFHCAGVMTVNRVAQSDEQVWAINYEGARYVLEECQRRGVKALVFTSSASVVQREKGGFLDILNGDEGMPTVGEKDGGMIYPRSKVRSTPFSTIFSIAHRCG
jgi:sterol-4alpha-carboxylate 3-dehydrogenase (decarboxylating)